MGPDSVLGEEGYPLQFGKKENNKNKHDSQRQSHFTLKPEFFAEAVISVND